MDLQDPSATPETDDIALLELPECDEEDVQRCVSETRSLPEAGGERTRLRALQVRVGDVLSTPVVGLMTQIALELEVLV